MNVDKYGGSCFRVLYLSLRHPAFSQDIIICVYTCTLYSSPFSQLHRFLHVCLFLFVCLSFYLPYPSPVPYFLIFPPSNVSFTFLLPPSLPPYLPLPPPSLHTYPLPLFFPIHFFILSPPSSPLLPYPSPHSPPLSQPPPFPSLSVSLCLSLYLSIRVYTNQVGM